MFQIDGDSIVETAMTTTTGGTMAWNNIVYLYGPTYWNSYPVYVCTDKTKKAIDIMKALQSDKIIECKSVPKFIELVEKISNLL